MKIGKNKLQIEGTPNIQYLHGSVIFKDDIEIVIDKINLQRALNIIKMNENKHK